MGASPVRCWVPEGKALEAVRRYSGILGPWQRGVLSVEPIPFMPQPDYDTLLRSCAINFVRGEDSFVRAQWAAHPFVWQIYPQADDVHLAKLSAFTQRYTEGLPDDLGQVVSNMMFAWNTGQDVGPAWQAFERYRDALAYHAARWAVALAQPPDLARNLVNFCAGKV
jgi:uncharacterized repeat protein (TIGR03837 family)